MICQKCLCPVKYISVCMRLPIKEPLKAMAQAVSRQPLTTEAQVNPCGICGVQSGSGTGFSLEFFCFPCQYHSTMAFHTHISFGGWTTGLLVLQFRDIVSPICTSTTTSPYDLLFSHFFPFKCVISIPVLWVTGMSMSNYEYDCEC
jgi:hypothetical protein